jgi:hypothetical protein
MRFLKNKILTQTKGPLIAKRSITNNKNNQDGRQTNNEIQTKHYVSEKALLRPLHP